jgi:SAM-dependent methyltransferase
MQAMSMVGTSGRSATQIRRESYRHPMAADDELVSLARSTPSHAFLTGAAHLVYVQQVAYLQALFAERARDHRVAPRALDWGAGKGHTAFLLNKAGFAVDSCDVKGDESDSSFGQPTPILDHLGVAVTPLEHVSALPYPDRSFELVTSFGVLEHVGDERASLREIHRVLQPGGVLFISFLPRTWSWTQWLARARGNEYHDRLYRASRTKDLLAQANFEIADMFRGQLFPKNSMPMNARIERLDDLITRFTPLGRLATNFIVTAIARPAAADAA